MVCPFNAALKAIKEVLGVPFDYVMHAGSSLNQANFENDEMHLASADQANAFTHVVVPKWWRKFQAGPRVQVKELPSPWWVGRFRPEQCLRPQYCRLAMGRC